MSKFKCPPSRNDQNVNSIMRKVIYLNKFLAYKRKRSGYMSELTKVINKIKEYLNKNQLSKIDSHNNRLDLIIEKICPASSKLNKLVCDDDVSEEFQFCTDQELRVIELRKSIYSVVPEFKQGPIPHDPTFETKNPEKAY